MRRDCTPPSLNLATNSGACQPPAHPQDCDDLVELEIPTDEEVVVRFTRPGPRSRACCADEPAAPAINFVAISIEDGVILFEDGEALETEDGQMIVIE